MKVLLLTVVAWSVCGTVFSAPRFVTPGMVRRNGLTDEQYELLWRQGKHPQITVDAARDWIFRASRFQNVTNWLEVIGRTNDFARLVVPTMTTNEMLVATNRTLAVEITYLDHTVGKLRTELAAAESDAEIYRAVRKAASRTEKNLEKVIKALDKARDKAQTKDEAALYSALIAVLRGQSPNDGTAGTGLGQEDLL